MIFDLFLPIVHGGSISTREGEPTKNSWILSVVIGRDSEASLTTGSRIRINVVRDYEPSLDGAEAFAQEILRQVRAGREEVTRRNLVMVLSRAKGAAHEPK